MAEGDTQKTSKKKVKKAKRQMDHPKYLDMIIEAIETMQERKGSSRQAIVKYIRSHFKIRDENVEIYVKNALKMGLKYERLKLATGRGVSGSFRVADTKGTSRKPGGRKPAATSKKSTGTKSKKNVKRPATKATKSRNTKSRDAKTKTAAKRGSKAKPKAAKKKGKKSKKRTG